MDASETKRLKALEEENAKLKRMYADIELESSIQRTSTAWLIGGLPPTVYAQQTPENSGFELSNWLESLR